MWVCSIGWALDYKSWSWGPPALHPGDDPGALPYRSRLPQLGLESTRSASSPWLSNSTESLLHNIYTTRSTAVQPGGSVRWLSPTHSTRLRNSATGNSWVWLTTLSTRSSAGRQVAELGSPHSTRTPLEEGSGVWLTRSSETQLEESSWVWLTHTTHTTVELPDSL